LLYNFLRQNNHIRSPPQFPPANSGATTGGISEENSKI
jgi:hypothetical protein